MRRFLQIRLRKGSRHVFLFFHSLQPKTLYTKEQRDAGSKIFRAKGVTSLIFDIDKYQKVTTRFGTFHFHYFNTSLRKEILCQDHYVLSIHARIQGTPYLILEISILLL